MLCGCVCACVRACVCVCVGVWPTLLLPDGPHELFIENSNQPGQLFSEKMSGWDLIPRLSSMYNTVQIMYVCV